MDSVMSSPVGQVAVPAVAGYASARSPAGARGVNSALMMNQIMQKRAEDQRLREFFGTQIKPEHNANADMAGTPTTSYDQDQVGPTWQTALKAGMAGMDPYEVMRIGTHLAKIASDNDMAKNRPISVDGSLMSPGGRVLGSAPVRDPFKGGAYGTVNTVTGDYMEAPHVVAKTEQNADYNNARIDRLGTLMEADSALAKEREAGAGAKDALAGERDARAEKIRKETEKINAKPEGYSPNEITGQIRAITYAQKEGLIPEEEAKHDIARLRGLLKGKAENESVGVDMVSSHGGPVPSGTAYDFVNGQLVPR